MAEKAETLGWMDNGQSNITNLLLQPENEISHRRYEILISYQWNTHVYILHMGATSRLYWPFFLQGTQSKYWWSLLTTPHSVGLSEIQKLCHLGSCSGLYRADFSSLTTLAKYREHINQTLTICFMACYQHTKLILISYEWCKQPVKVLDKMRSLLTLPQLFGYSQKR